MLQRSSARIEARASSQKAQKLTEAANPRPASASRHNSMATNGAGVKTRSGSKRPGTELDRNTANTSQGGGLEEGVTPVPLKYVVQEAVKRWFEDTMLEAQRGDVKQQALLGQMYNEGYGVTKDVKAGKEWTDKANSKGYRMQGVYCEL